MRIATAQPDAAARTVARMYGRVLASWAQDALRLRRARLDRPTARERGAWGAIGIGSVRSEQTASRRLAG